MAYKDALHLKRNENKPTKTVNIKSSVSDPDPRVFVRSGSAKNADPDPGQKGKE